MVDALGFGAMTSVSMVENVNHPDRPDGLLPLRHPLFKRTGIHVGMPARKIVKRASPPGIALGILDRSGKRGRIGGGVYRPPLSLFAEATAALN